MMSDMYKITDTNFSMPTAYRDTYGGFADWRTSSTLAQNSRYSKTSTEVVANVEAQIDSTIERTAQWFLSMSSMSNKKLQKLCYYAYCWFIVFFNDVESITLKNCDEIRVLCADRFQAWIHGPVSPRLYFRYKEYGWRDIPMLKEKPVINAELEALFQQVWDAYGSFTADELEAISHRETPWLNARRGVAKGEACSNEISNYDILLYYSSLG